ESPSLLVVVLDVNPFTWQTAPISFDEALKQLLVFMNAYLALKHDNAMAIIATSYNFCEFLYPDAPMDAETPTDSAAAMASSTEGNLYPKFKHLDEQVLTQIRLLIQKHVQHTATPADNDTDSDPTKPRNSVQMTIALSRALCYINRYRSTDSIMHLQPRILVLSASADASSQYIQIMNCIFACQKLSIPLDACKIYGDDSTFLQQATSITNGIYVRLSHPRGLLEYLMFSFLPDAYARQFLVAPSPTSVDFRAACFCHKKIVDIGYVCSVCLSIFCAFTPVCSTCRTKFAFTPQ
ncbi:RNA polymerase II transcription factor B subunit 4, partial [Dimargaris cristalligena]